MTGEDEQTEFERLVGEAREAFNAREWGKAREILQDAFGPAASRRRRHGRRRRRRTESAVAAVEDGPKVEPQASGDEDGAAQTSVLRTFEQFLAEAAAESDSPETAARVLETLRRHKRSARWLDRIVSRHLDRHGFDERRLRTSIASIVEQVQQNRPDLQRRLARDGTITILFTDIAGSTALAEYLGDEGWIEVIRAHNAIVREQVLAHRGREISNRGDGFMVTFLLADEAVHCAVDIQRAISAHRFEAIEAPVEVHIGVHTGTPAKHEGNFYGTDVNIAARIADHVAGPGEILVSGAVRERLVHHAELVGEGEEVALEGLSGLHAVFPVRWWEGDA